MVQFVTDGLMADVEIGSPMLPKPGVTLIQIQTLPHVYASFEDPEDDDKLLIRKIDSPALAEEIYGADWEDYIVELPMTLWSRLTVGEDIVTADDHSPDLSTMKKNTKLK